VLATLGNHEELPLVERDITVSRLDRQAALENQEEVVCVVVFVPDELAFDLDDLQLVVVDLTDDPRLVRLAEKTEVLPQFTFWFMPRADGRLLLRRGCAPTLGLPRGWRAGPRNELKLTGCEDRAVLGD
jgi:hypothetical protein